MEVTLYAFQMVPGDDDLLFFADTLENCQAAALEQRADLKREDPEDGELSAMAVYRCTMRLPDAGAMISVLNERDTLFRACIVERTLVAVVAD